MDDANHVSISTFPWSNDASKPSASRICRWLSTWMQQIGAAGHPEALERIDSVSRLHKEILERTLEVIPKATAASVRECGLAFFAVRKLQAPRELLGEHLVDPRSYRAFARDLEELAHELERDPATDHELGTCLTELNARGGLGLETLRDLSLFLISVDQSDGHEPLTARGPLLIQDDTQLDVHHLEAFRRSLEKHNPLWGPRAVARALNQETVQFSGLLAPKMSWNTSIRMSADASSLEWLEPGVPEWAHVDAEEICKIQEFVDFDPQLDDRSKASIYLAVRVIESIVQGAWLTRFKVQIRVDPTLGPWIAQERSKRTLWCGLQALHTPCTLVAELGRALDDHMVNEHGYASEQDTEDLCAFVDMVRPEVIRSQRPKIEARAARQMESVILRKLQEHEGENFIDRIEGDLGTLVRMNEEPDLARVRRSLTTCSEIDALDFLRLGRTGARFDPDLAERLFIAKRLREATEGPQIFAAFLEQYARLYWMQQKRAYGPRTLYHDLDPFVLVNHVSMFHSALATAQVRDLKEIKASRGERLTETTVGALGLSGVMGLFGLGIIKIPSS